MKNPLSSPSPLTPSSVLSYLSPSFRFILHPKDPGQHPPAKCWSPATQVRPLQGTFYDLRSNLSKVQVPHKCHVESIGYHLPCLASVNSTENNCNCGAGSSRNSSFRLSSRFGLRNTRVKPLRGLSTLSLSGLRNRTWTMNTACSTAPEGHSPTTRWLTPSRRGWRSSLPSSLMAP